MRLAPTILFVFAGLCITLSCKKEPTETEPDTHQYSLMISGAWKLSSTPLSFGESIFKNDLKYGMNRAKISWYSIDAGVFYDRSANQRPANISLDDISEDACRVIYANELFPEAEMPENQPTILPTLNIDFYPEERGPHNFDTDPSEYSSGLSPDGRLLNPESRWSGITYKIPAMDYRFHYLDFWLLDPSNGFPGVTGELFIDIGQISEDVLSDGMLSAEHFTAGNPEFSVWGLVRPLDTEPYFSVSASFKQDLGLDGMDSPQEQAHFQDYLGRLQQICNEDFYLSVNQDVSGDDFHYFLGSDYDALNYKVRDRYKNYPGTELNSSGTNGSSNISSRIPDSEDLNSNGILDTVNYYSEFKIDIDPALFTAGQNYIAEKYRFNSDFSSLMLENGKSYTSTYYHFIIPLDNAIASNGISYPAVLPGYIRIFLTGFSQEINLRIIGLRLSEKLPD